MMGCEVATVRLGDLYIKTHGIWLNKVGPAKVHVPRALPQVIGDLKPC